MMHRGKHPKQPELEGPFSNCITTLPATPAFAHALMRPARAHGHWPFHWEHRRWQHLHAIERISHTVNNHHLLPTCHDCQCHAVGMRSILNTTLSWGMVRIPVKVYTATSTHDRDLHQYHREDAGRIRYERVCELDDEPVPSKEITKGVEDRDGNLVIIEDDELENLPVTSKVIETLTFVPNEQIDTIYYEKSYYLGPGDGGTEPYIVLRDALAEKGLIAIVAFTMRQRESLAAVRPHGDVLVLTTMLWADEVRVPNADLPAGAVDSAELELAQILINAKTGDWEPEQFDDQYQQALDELIEAKAAGREVPKAKKERRPKVTSIMDALQKSLEQSTPDRPPPATARKATAKKAAKKSTRKPTAKKAPKAAVRKPSSSLRTAALQGFFKFLKGVVVVDAQDR
jgi:DNA end-binding protein Ku